MTDSMEIRRAATDLSEDDLEDTWVTHRDDLQPALIEGRSDTAPRFALVVMLHTDSALLGRWYELPENGSLDIGRSPALEISFPEISAMSRVHARIRRNGSRVILEDLASTNGTSVNGERIHGERPLVNGDRIQLPSVHLKFFGGGDIEQTFFEAIYEIVVRDELTQIFNRRKFEETLKTEVACSERYNRPVSLLLFDIDGFKAINDRYGHPTGDAVLQQLARLVSRTLRRQEIFARIGGEEFAVVCTDTPANGAARLAERLRQTIASHRFETGAESLRLTCSFGLAEVTRAMERPSDLYAAADLSLYQAKKSGGNTVGWTG